MHTFSGICGNESQFSLFFCFILLFNATDPEKRKQICIQKVDTNSCRGELVPLEQQQKAELKFSGSNKKEEDRKVQQQTPQQREERGTSFCPAKKKPSTRDRRGYSDNRHVQTAVIAVFFAASVFN